jgi:hypothetical protein
MIRWCSGLGPSLRWDDEYLACGRSNFMPHVSPCIRRNFLIKCQEGQRVWGCAGDSVDMPTACATAVQCSRQRALQGRGMLTRRNALAGCALTGACAQRRRAGSASESAEHGSCGASCGQLIQYRLDRVVIDKKQHTPRREPARERPKAVPR